MIEVPVSPGELLDKITILEIKCDRLHSPQALAHVRRELLLLQQVREWGVAHNPEREHLAAALREVTDTLWDIEDRIRECERAGDFGSDFITLARSVYKQNDRRAALKREINQLLQSDIAEQKSYAAY